MKFGYHTESWGWKTITPRSFPLVLNQISESGFKGFETHDVDILPFLGREKDFFDMLSEKQLQLASIHIYGYFYEPTIHLPHLMPWFNRFRTRISWIWKHVPKIINFAVKVGCKRLVIIGGEKKEERIKDKHYLKMAKTLNKIGKISKNCGVKTTYHPMKQSIVSRIGQLAKLCELTDPDYVYLTLDTGHWVASGGNLVEVIKTYHKRIRHIHFRDFKEGKFVEFGTGTIDFSNLLKLLNFMGYDDWVIIENDYKIINSARTTPLRSAKKAKMYIKHYLSML